MKHLGKAIAVAFLAAFLVSPTTAQAQYMGGGGGGGYYGTGDKAIEGTIQGTVRSLSLERGIVRVSSGSGSMTLHATPDQLADVQLGAIYDFEYGKYGNWYWVTGAGGGMSGMGGSGIGVGGGFSGDDWGSEGTVSGVVTKLNFERGLIFIDGRPFRTHPGDLQGVLPGQLVSLSFRQIGSTNWLDTYGSGASLGGTGGGLGGGGSYGGNIGGSGGAVRGGTGGSGFRGGFP